MRVIASVIVSRSAEALFWMSQDYARRLEWDSYLSEAYLLGNALSANVGVESFCKSRAGPVMVSRYISFSPPTYAAVKMTRGPWVLGSFGGTWRFKSLPGGQTEVRFIYNFKARPRFLRWLVEPLIGLLYRRDMESRLNAFKAWAQAADSVPVATCQ